MAWFEDLGPCNYFGGDFAECFRAVGWLGEGQPYATGVVDEVVVKRLKNLFETPWCCFIFMGGHGCEICLSAVGSANLFIPANGFVFVCPELIVHYIAEHQYRPPDEFCRAVLECPPMSSDPYLEALRMNAPPFARFLDQLEVGGIEMDLQRRIRKRKKRESHRRRQKMWRYGERGVAKWVMEYGAGEGFLKLRFHNETIRMFTDAATGAEHVETMKRLARSGHGLEEYIRRERPRSIPDPGAGTDDARNNFDSRRWQK